MTATFSFDDRRRIAIGDSVEHTLEFAATHLVTVGKSAIEEKDAFYIALSGGSTPKQLFSLLPIDPYRNTLDWAKVHIFWSDERSVPPDNPDSNYHMAMTHGIEKLAIPKNNIHRMHAEENIEENAKKYAELILEVTQGTFDLIMLGMGDDGHTASLFPNTKALNETEKLVVANEVPQKNTQRMTFTFPLINKAKHAVIYVMGEGKAERVRDIFSEDGEQYPVARVGTHTHPALWVMDQEAASTAPFA